MPSLVVERGQEKGFSFQLTPGEDVVVGRDPANQVIISDPASSRRHFQIRCESGVWFITDLGSRNATYVNEEKLDKEQTLAFGDRVQVGETVFSFLEEDQADKGKAAGLAGRDIAGYKILERVGRGGMGTVYRARQISLNRICAFKILSTKYASDPNFVEQFVAEARAAAQLNHPNVVQVFDVGQAGGIHFFSMEFMEGAAIQDLLSKSEDGRLPWTEALPLMMDACKGLVFAERHGIIHRDIKPDNLMLTVENKVKIGDLGLAARADEVGDGKIFGTPHFIAPEQARGKDLTHAADLYSLGASFYRVVTGRTPFSGTTVKEILRKQINDPHVPVVNEVEGFPPDLSAIIDKMMQKKVEDRYQSATDLLADLEAFEIEHKIELAGGRKRNKGLLAVAAVLIIALGGVVAWQLNKDPRTITKTEYVKDNTPRGPEGIDPAVLAAEKKAAQENAARAAYFEVKSEDPGTDIDLAKKDAWLAQARAYEEMAKAHPGTAAVRDADTRAKEIRETLTREEQEYEATVGQAKAWWSAEKQKIDDLLDAGDWSAVLNAATRIPASREAKKHLQHILDATSYLDGLQQEVLKRARASFDSLLAASAKKIENGTTGVAIADVVDWADAMQRHASAHADLQQMETDARTWASERGEEIRAELADYVVQDRLAYAAMSRDVRAVGAPEGSVSVFDWRFADAATHIRTKAKDLQTWVYADRAERRAAQLDAAAEAWSALIEALQAGTIIGPEQQIQGLSGLPKGAKVTLSKSKKITDSDISFDASIGPASTRKTLDWVDVDRGMLWDSLLAANVAKIPGDLALGLSRIFIEVGHHAAALALYERAKAAGALPATADQVALEQELAALRAYSAMVQSEATPEEKIAQFKDWRDRYRLTEVYLLLDGRDATALPDLLSASTVRSYLESWGVRPQ